MDTKIIQQLFKMKYGPRGEKYQPGGHLPEWDKDLNALLEELNRRKNLLNEAAKILASSGEKRIDIYSIMRNASIVFSEFNALTITSKQPDCIIAHSHLMLIYGIKMCTHIFAQIETKEDAKMFYNFYMFLWQKTKKITGICQDNFEHLNHYSFKVGIQWLSFSLETRGIHDNFFDLDEGYGLILKGHFSTENIHTQSYERNLKGGYDSLNPFYLITTSLVGSTKGTTTEYFFNCVEKDVRKAIEMTD